MRWKNRADKAEKSGSFFTVVEESGVLGGRIGHSDSPPVISFGGRIEEPWLAPYNMLKIGDNRRA
jgi:hypothetical protein